MFKRVNNKYMGRLVASRVEFENHKGSCFAHYNKNAYVVYSYGAHFPIYCYDRNTGQWFGNKDKYSRTTTNHQSCAWPSGVSHERISWVDTRTLQTIALYGFTGYVAERMK